MTHINSSEVLTPKQTEILRTAILLAKHIQHNKVSVLKRSLLHMWPGQVEDIDAALIFWAEHETRLILDKVKDTSKKVKSEN